MWRRAHKKKKRRGGCQIAELTSLLFLVLLSETPPRGQRQPGSPGSRRAVDSVGVWLTIQACVIDVRAIEVIFWVFIVSYICVDLMSAQCRIIQTGTAELLHTRSVLARAHITSRGHRPQAPVGISINQTG